MLEIVYILQRLIKRFIPSMITLLANQVTECFFPQHLPSSKKKKNSFFSMVHSFFYFQNGEVQGCNCDGLNRVLPIQMIRNFVEGKQENGPK